MKKRNVECIVVFGETTLANPDLTYVVGGTLPRGGLYFKSAGKEPLLLLSNLDIATAKRLGRVRRIQTYTDWGMEKLSKEYRSRDEAFARLIALVLKREGVSGKVGLFGRTDLASGIQLADQLRRIGPKVVGSQSPTILESARETKDRTEIAQVRNVGTGTSEVVTEIAAMLRNAKYKRGHLYFGRDRATIGLVKSAIATGIAKKNLVPPEGTIFAIGPSGADPHNMGIVTDEIKKNSLIVFDIFPQGQSGYWFDLTRTWVVGRASRKARLMYQAVAEAQTAALDSLRSGVAEEKPMRIACDVIERHGYRTIREVYQGKSNTLYSGFNHSLGHGVGLTIGEKPYLSFYGKNRLKEHQVVTVEPGVYLPHYGGVRIEDTVMITKRGFDNLASVPKELDLV